MYEICLWNKDNKNFLNNFLDRGVKGQCSKGSDKAGKD